MALTDEQIANIIFNETRSLSGALIAEARTNVAHAIINGQKLKGRPKSGPTKATVPDVEKQTYADCKVAIKTARANGAKSVDPTNGATNFNFRKNNWTGDFYALPIKTQVGPLNNSYPTTDLPATNIYANTYGK
jgi:hypothetical protein